MVSSCEAVAFGYWSKHFQQYVVVRGHTCDVCFSVGGVCVAFVWRDKRSRLVVERGHGCCVPVKGAIEFLVDCKTIIPLHYVEYIEGLLHLSEESTPQLEGTAYIRGRDGGYNVSVVHAVVGFHWEISG